MHSMEKEKNLIATGYQNMVSKKSLKKGFSGSKYCLANIKKELLKKKSRNDRSNLIILLSTF